MISKDDWDELFAIPADPDSPILSLYLNVDQSQQRNLNRGFETTLKNLIKELRGSTAEGPPDHLDADIAHVQKYLDDYEPHGKTLVLFCDESAGLLWSRELRVPLDSQVRWTALPFLRPIAEARDEFQRYCVVLTDRGHTRLFSVYLNEVEEDKESLAHSDVRKFDASGKDKSRSQMNFQRRADEHARRHLESVVAMVDQMADERKFDRMILAGPTEAVSEVEKMLTHRLKERIIGTTSIAMTASKKEVLAITNELEESHEREAESQLVTELLTAAAKNNGAATGLPDVVRACTEGRIRKLIYADGLESEGGRCASCGALFVGKVTRCEHCGKEVTAVQDILDYLIEKAIRNGAEIEHVRGSAADRLKEDGESVGALLYH